MGKQEALRTIVVVVVRIAIAIAIARNRRISQHSEKCSRLVFCSVLVFFLRISDELIFWNLVDGRNLQEIPGFIRFAGNRVRDRGSVKWNGSTESSEDSKIHPIRRKSCAGSRFGKVESSGWMESSEDSRKIPGFIRFAGVRVRGRGPVKWNLPDGWNLLKILGFI
jgi:hypothetical protein